MMERPSRSYDLPKAHGNGEITIRQITSLTGLSPDRTYEVVTAIYDHHDDLVDEGEPCPVTITPDDVLDG